MPENAGHVAVAVIGVRSQENRKFRSTATLSLYSVFSAPLCSSVAKSDASLGYMWEVFSNFISRIEEYFYSRMDV